MSNLRIPASVEPMKWRWTTLRTPKRWENLTAGTEFETEATFLYLTPLLSGDLSFDG